MRRLILAVALVAALAAPAWADLDAGVDAWERGDYAAAYRNWKPLADQGDADAQYNLGVWYYHVEQDYVNAAKWYRKAAHQGHASAQHDLGSLYTLGQGVLQSVAVAARWFRLAAEQEHPMGQYNLGASYYYGLGVPQDYYEAAKWFRKAADAGIPMAQINLATMYAEGQGVPRDYAEAAYWSRLAAEKSVDSALRIAGAFETGAFGDKVRVVPGLSVDTYREGVTNALAIAKRGLGYLYAEGLGVPRDYVQAFMWFQLAADQGDDEAAYNRDVLAARMTPAQIADAQRLAREWKPKSE